MHVIVYTLCMWPVIASTSARSFALLKCSHVAVNLLSVT